MGETKWGKTYLYTISGRGNVTDTLRSNLGQIFLREPKCRLLSQAGAEPLPARCWGAGQGPPGPRGGGAGTGQGHGAGRGQRPKVLISSPAQGLRPNRANKLLFGKVVKKQPQRRTPDPYVITRN